MTFMNYKNIYETKSKRNQSFFNYEIHKSLTSKFSINNIKQDIN